MEENFSFFRINLPGKICSSSIIDAAISIDFGRYGSIFSKTKSDDY
jgi:hypothetical protein